MAVRLIREADLGRRPWKNGGGTTVEIAVFPDGADFDTFDWRLSMADVVADGAFSAFPDIDRTLVLIGGPGIVLDVAGESRRLDEVERMLSFPGEAATFAHLIGGPIRDFNVMTRRGRASHAVRLVAAGALTDGRATFVLAHAGPVGVEVDGSLYSLGRFDTLHVLGRSALRVTGPALLAAIEHTASTDVQDTVNAQGGN